MNKTTQNKRYQTTLNTGCTDRNVFCELLAAKCMKLTFNRPNTQTVSHTSAVYAVLGNINEYYSIQKTFFCPPFTGDKCNWLQKVYKIKKQICLIC